MIPQDPPDENPLELSPEIHDLAYKEKLGKLCKVYPVSKHETRIWKSGVGCIILGIMWFLMSTIFSVAFLTLPPFNTQPISASILIVCAAATPGLISLIIGIYLTSLRKHYSDWQVSHWQDGFIYEKKQLRHVFRWSQIESVQLSVVGIVATLSPIVYQCKVQHQEGYEATLGIEFSHISELIDVVLRESARHLGPSDLNIASPTQTSTFTDLKLDRQGIGNAQVMLAWHEIQAFITTNGNVTLCKKAD